MTEYLGGFERNEESGHEQYSIPAGRGRRQDEGHVEPAGTALVQLAHSMFPLNQEIAVNDFPARTGKADPFLSSPQHASSVIEDRNIVL
jgi:hypothetical protein